jgi:hypothetical protein
VGDNIFKFGGGSTATIMHPVVLLATVIASLLILLLPRRWAIVPLLLLVFFAPWGQQFYLGGVHFLVMRIAVLAGIPRLLAAKLTSQRAFLAGGFNSIDNAFCLWAVFRVAAFILQYREWGAVGNQVGFLIDTLGGYFLLRYLIQDEGDIARMGKLLAAVAVVMGVCMLNEQFRRVNIFGYTGSLTVIPQSRDGQIRAQGAFGHPVLAGTFGATLVPLLFWLWKSGRARGTAIAGFVGSTAVVLAAASSTPLLAYIVGIGSLCLWPIRKYMRLVRWGIVIVLLGLAMVMKAPVWFIIAHLDVFSASSGWHRAALIDTLVKHFGAWWALGAANNETWGPEMIDTSNQFVAEAVSGGLLALTCFILIICRGFSLLGTARKMAEGDRNREWCLWSLGALLMAHVVAFWGTAYWDQTRISFFAALTIISVATACLQSAGEEKKEIARVEVQAVPWRQKPAVLRESSRKTGEPTRTM